MCQGVPIHPYIQASLSGTHLLSSYYVPGTGLHAGYKQWGLFTELGVPWGRPKTNNLIAKCDRSQESFHLTPEHY